MRTKPFIFILFLVFFLLLVSAWNWDTHQHIVQSFYYSLPSHLKERFNLTALEEGAIAPDRDFKDHKDHHYPTTYDKAVQWVTTARDALAHDDTNYASYALGVASHYITDSYAAPHYTKEAYKDHQRYEDQASRDYPLTGCGTAPKVAWDDLLRQGADEGITWNLWMQTKDKQIPQRAAQRATQAAYTILLEALNATCTQEATYYMRSHRLTLPKIATLAFLTLVILILVHSLFPDLKLLLRHEEQEHGDDRQREY